MEEGVRKLDGFGSLLLKEDLHKHKETGDDGGSLGREGRTLEYVLALEERVIHLGRLGNTVFDGRIGKDLDIVALPQIKSFT